MRASVTPTPLYDAFSSDYDRFVHWPGRLAHELPFLQQQLVAAGASRVLDAACGTGMHAIALAQQGYAVTGADISAGMIDRARANAQSAGLALHFVVAGFGELAQQAGANFDALLCLGNSLPHVLTEQELALTLTDFATALRPGGLLLIQNRNFDAVLAGRNRWMEPQTHCEGDREWLFVRFYDFNPNGTLAFNVVTLQRDGEANWTSSAEATLLRPWCARELRPALAAAGFEAITEYGDATGSPFDPQSSGNLILTALRHKSFSPPGKDATITA